MKLIRQSLAYVKRMSQLTSTGRNKVLHLRNPRQLAAGPS